jgi:hypothetical protein
VFICLFTLVEWDALAGYFESALMTHRAADYVGLHWTNFVGYFTAVALALAICVPNLALMLSLSRSFWKGGIQNLVKNLRHSNIMYVSAFTLIEWYVLYTQFGLLFVTAMGLPGYWLDSLGASFTADQAAMVASTVACFPNILWITALLRKRH